MNDLSGSRILITGGAGFVGSHIADQLIAQEGVSEVVLLDNMLRGSRRNIEEALGSGAPSSSRGTSGTGPLVDRLLPGVDYVFHMAALRITRCAENPREALEVMFDGAFNVVGVLCSFHFVKERIIPSNSIQPWVSLCGRMEVNHRLILFQVRGPIV